MWMNLQNETFDLEIMITDDLGFSENLVQLRDIPVGPDCSESMAVLNREMVCVAV